MAKGLGISQKKLFSGVAKECEVVRSGGRILLVLKPCDENEKPEIIHKIKIKQLGKTRRKSSFRKHKKLKTKQRKTKTLKHKTLKYKKSKRKTKSLKHKK